MHKPNFVRQPVVWGAIVAIALLGVISGCSAPAATVEPTQPQAEQTSSPPAATATTATSPLPTATTQSPLPTPTEPATDTPEATTSPVDTPESITWAADGVISAEEYDRDADFGDIRLWWRNDAEYLYIAMEGDTTGWVAVGIDPEDGMAGANYLFGYVADGEASLWDAYGTAPRGPNHPPDEDLGGTDDIVAFAGVEEDGVTRFEVQIPLDSGDQYDKALQSGQTYPVIVAIGGEDEFNAYHLRYDRGELILE